MPSWTVFEAGTRSGEGAFCYPLAAMTRKIEGKRRWGIAVVALGTAALIAGSAYRQRAVGRWRLRSDLGEVPSHRDIRYLPESRHAKHRLDVYRAHGGSPRPVVHFVHGGYWTEGDKDHHRWLTGLYGSIGQALALRGITTVVQSYRLAPEVQLPAMQRDVEAGLCWTKRSIINHGGDPRKIVLMGHSAGGHLVAQVATQPLGRCPGPSVLGYVVLSAIWDIADMRLRQEEGFHREVTWPVFGTDGSNDHGFSPIHHLAKLKAPLLVAVGERDAPYLIPQARQAFAKLKGLSPGHRFALVAGATHRDMVLGFGTPQSALEQIVADFVESLALRGQ